MLLGTGRDLTGVDGREGTREVGVEGLVAERVLGVDDLVDVIDCELVLSIEGDGRDIDVTDCELVLSIEARLELGE